jgi:hypothetical protein
MKKALIVLAAVAATCASTYAQASSAVIFRNRNIATAQPDPALPGYIAGGNQNGSYHVGIYEFGGLAAKNGAGDLPGGVTVGLYYQDQLLATALLGTTVAGAPFFVTPSTQDVVIRDAAGNPLAPGSTPTLVARAWTTESGSFANAKTDVVGNLGQYGEWTFTSPPISGAGSPPSLPPTLTGWGPVDGSGLELQIAPEPSTIALGVLGLGALVLARRRK